MIQSESKQITELRKSGHLEDAWNMALGILNERPGDESIKLSAYYCAYEYLKQIAAQIKEKEKTHVGAGYNLSPTEVSQISYYLDFITKFDISPEKVKYKFLVILLKKHLSSFPFFVYYLFFLRDVLFDEPSDWTPFKTEKGEIPSLMLSFARAVNEIWLIDEKFRAIPLDLLCEYIEKVRTICKEKNSMWLDYDLAKCLVFAKEYEKARKLILEILKIKQSESWAWGALASTYISTDAHLAIKFFAQGIISSREEKFSVKLIKGIIPLLSAGNFTDEASICATKLVDIYESNGWRLKEDVEKFTRQPWYKKNDDYGRLNNFLKGQAEDAITALYDDAKTVVGIVTERLRSGKGIKLFVTEKQSLIVQFRNIKNHSKVNVGDYIKAKYVKTQDEENIIEAELTDKTPIAGVEEIEGEMQVSPAGFGFIKHTFVPQFLVKPGMDKQQVKAVRFRAFNKKKNQMDWKAMSVQKI